MSSQPRPPSVLDRVGLGEPVARAAALVLAVAMIVTLVDVDVASTALQSAKAFVVGRFDLLFIVAVNLAIGVTLLAIGGGVIGWQLSLPDDEASGDDVTTEDNGGEGGDSAGGSDPDLTTSALQALDAEQFTAPGGTDGIIFGSAANSFGLTMVGGAGDGENVRSQSSQMWTLEPDGDGFTIIHRPAFAQDSAAETGEQRLWGIGVIDNEQFLAVGDVAAGGTTDGLAWVGDRAGTFTRVIDPSFTGAGTDALRAAVDDGDSAFIVVGRRSDESVSMPGLWELSNTTGDWTEATWTTIDFGAADGVLNDVATSESLAVAVGQDPRGGIIAIRRDSGWSDLISPIPGAGFWSVTIAGDRIIAVGQAADDTPFAIISTPGGEGSVHRLPIRGDVGVARDVITRSNGDVVVIGDSDWTSAPEDENAASFDRDGAVWQLIPGADDAPNFNDDRWTTQASGDLRQPGFIEFWTISEYEDRLYVFGRTEDDTDQPAGAWTLDLE